MQRQQSFFIIYYTRRCLERFSQTKVKDNAIVGIHHSELPTRTVFWASWTNYFLVVRKWHLLGWSFSSSSLLWCVLSLKVGKRTTQKRIYSIDRSYRCRIHKVNGNFSLCDLLFSSYPYDRLIALALTFSPMLKSALVFAYFLTC